MNKTRNNHYVPQWYQKGFFANGKEQLYYLSLQPKIISLPNGYKEVYTKKLYAPSQCFYQKDLYTTFFGKHINDDIERILFGQIDYIGFKAIRAFIGGDFVKQHYNFENFFTYLDSQKIRTPKGLDWIQHRYPKLNQLELMIEMQAIQSIHCTLWTEGVREIVSAKDSEVKFIISDHPVTIYNYACPPDSEYSKYPNDPSIALKATQTIYPLDKDHALILTNLEYAQEPLGVDPLEQRTYAQKMRQSLVRTDALIRSRKLVAEEVTKINYIIKSRAKQFVGAGKDEWLYPEKDVQDDWADLRSILLPPREQLFQFGGEIFAGFKDGSTHYQDAFGRRTPENEYLKKDLDENKIGKNDLCGCGSGKKYKNCCKNVSHEERTTWKVLSIRERNIVLYRAIYSILGLDNGKTWDDVRRELSNEQIKEIYSVYASLWPVETDIYALLPKPDRKLRSIYTGFIDPRTIGKVALAMIPYFDELLIQHPFVNPNKVKAEFSPIESPNKFKYQALKDILFLLNIESFIMSGVVNLIPDPCDFDEHLNRQMLQMARHRSGIAMISNRDKEILSDLNLEDLLHTIMILPEHMKDKQIKNLFQGLSNDNLIKIKLALKSEVETNPLVLLQNFDFDNSSQFLMTNMAPNYEMSLFIAQAIGAVIVTDSESRWTEFQRAQYREQGIVIYPWDQLSSKFSEVKLYADLDDIYENYSNSEFVAIRKVLRGIDTILREISDDSNKITNLKHELINCFTEINHVSDGEQVHFAKIHIMMPKGGFVDKNVQRLLVKSSCEHYLNFTSMVMFIETKST